MTTTTVYEVAKWKGNKAEVKLFESDVEAVEFLKKQGATLVHTSEVGTEQYWLAGAEQCWMDGAVEYTYCIRKKLA